MRLFQSLTGTSFHKSSVRGQRTAATYHKVFVVTNACTKLGQTIMALVATGSNVLFILRRCRVLCWWAPTVGEPTHRPPLHTPIDTACPTHLRFTALVLLASFSVCWPPHNRGRATANNSEQQGMSYMWLWRLVLSPLPNVHDRHGDRWMKAAATAAWERVQVLSLFYWRCL